MLRFFLLRPHTAWSKYEPALPTFPLYHYKLQPYGETVPDTSGLASTVLGANPLEKYLSDWTQCNGIVGEISLIFRPGPMTCCSGQADALREEIAKS